jgi:hypothetical protein
LFLALGLKSRDQGAANEAFQLAVQGIDRLMKEGAEYSAMLGARGVLLPLVEQIDPALVSEVFWMAIASRPPVGNPRTVRPYMPTILVMLLAWYDREVAAALFEPVRAEMEHAGDHELAGRSLEFRAWSVLDPRAAAERQERVPVGLKGDLSAEPARWRLAESLGLPFEERWRSIWSTYTEMSFLFGRDLR